MGIIPMDMGTGVITPRTMGITATPALAVTIIGIGITGAAATAVTFGTIGFTGVKLRSI